MEKMAVVQMNSGADPEKNLMQLAVMLQKLQQQGAKLVLTPENSIVFGQQEDYQKYAEPLGKGRLQQRLSEMAQHYQLWLIVGSFPVRNNDGTLATTCLVFNDLGILVASYQKLHMFDVEVADSHYNYRESDTFTAGHEVIVVDTPFGKVGLSICYDVRFPMLYNELRRLGAEIIVIPAAFTKVTGSAHWEILLRSRAIETQCWVLAAGQWGNHGYGRETWGHSMIVDPWGNKIISKDEGIGCIVAKLDQPYLKAIRKKMPLVKQARICYQLS